MSRGIDAHGQPPVQFNQGWRVNRGIHELLGFLRGIAADKHISQTEAAQLMSWISANGEIANEWPVNILIDRLCRIYDDGVADEEERSDLAKLINEIVGHKDEDSYLWGPTDLPLTKPEPDVIFDSNEFVLTGRFLFGPRRTVQKEIELRGGRCSDTVRLQTAFLVIGSLTSRDWKFSSFGNKIAKAVEYAQRAPIAVISERHWQRFLLEG